jgi:replicative DNA helicase
LLLDPSAIGEVAVVLQARDFALLPHALIYQIMIELDSENRASLVTVAEELEHLGALEWVGGRSWLLRLVATMPLSFDPLQYAQVIAHLAAQRRRRAQDSEEAGHAPAWKGQQ